MIQQKLERNSIRESLLRTSTIFMVSNARKMKNYFMFLLTSTTRRNSLSKLRKFKMLLGSSWWSEGSTRVISSKKKFKLISEWKKSSTNAIKSLRRISMSYILIVKNLRILSLLLCLSWTLERNKLMSLLRFVKERIKFVNVVKM